MGQHKVFATFTRCFIVNDFRLPFSQYFNVVFTKPQTEYGLYLHASLSRLITILRLRISEITSHGRVPHLSLSKSIARPLQSASRDMRFPTMWHVRLPYAQSDQSFCYSLEYSMNIKPLTEDQLEFLFSLIQIRPNETKSRAWSGSKLFDTLTVFVKQYLENVDFVKQNKKRQKLMKNAQKTACLWSTPVVVLCIKLHGCQARSQVC